MEKLDAAVTRTLVQKLFEPDRLATMLRTIDEERSRTLAADDAELLRLETDLARAEARLSALYDGIELGLMSLHDPDIGKRIERAKSDRAIAQASRERVLIRIGPCFDLSADKIVALSRLMSDRVANGAVPFRKAYIRATVDQIIVDDETAVIHGSKEALRRHVGPTENPCETVPRSIQEWRARKDSNL